MIRMFALSIAGFAAAATVAPVHAQTTVVGSPAPSQAVYYGDLDLTNDRGKRTLQGRVRSAARSVCYVNFGTIPLHQMLETKACVAEAIEDAQPQIAEAVMNANSGLAIVASRKHLAVRAR